MASATKSPSTASACFFCRSWPSANSAAICLRVTVTCGAAFTETAFLAGAAAFFAEVTCFTGAAALAAGAVFVVVAAFSLAE
jgi:hypothetical protein